MTAVDNIKDNTGGVLRFFFSKHLSGLCSASLRFAVLAYAISCGFCSGVTLLNFILIALGWRHPVVMVVLALSVFLVVYFVQLYRAVQSKNDRLLHLLTYVKLIEMICWLLTTVTFLLFIVCAMFVPEKLESTFSSAGIFDKRQLGELKLTSVNGQEIEGEPIKLQINAVRRTLAEWCLKLAIVSAIVTCMHYCIGSAMYSLAHVFKVGGTGDEQMSADQIAGSAGQPILPVYAVPAAPAREVPVPDSGAAESAVNV